MKLIEKIKNIIFRNKDYNRSADYFNKKFAQKIRHNKPIYRVDILRAVKYDYNGIRGFGICTSISRVCRVYIYDNFSLREIASNGAKILFPKLSHSNAQNFHLFDDGGYWWKFNDWEGGRMQFLDWLIEEYKDDKENLRNIKF